jgi:hypothetical protein
VSSGYKNGYWTLSVASKDMEDERVMRQCCMLRLHGEMPKHGTEQLADVLALTTWPSSDEQPLRGWLKSTALLCVSATDSTAKNNSLSNLKFIFKNA